LNWAVDDFYFAARMNSKIESGEKLSQAFQFAFSQPSAGANWIAGLII